MATQQDDKQKKEKVQQLVARARRDPDFVQQARNDPVGTLRQEGFPEADIAEILRDDGYADLDPNDPQLTPKQKDAIGIARAAGRSASCPCTKCCITSFAK